MRSEFRERVKASRGRIARGARIKDVTAVGGTSSIIHARQPQDSAVASSCETFSLQELRKRGLHDVYALRLVPETSEVRLRPRASAVGAIHGRRRGCDAISRWPL